MLLSDFAKLQPEQQMTLLVAMHVRNEVEDFHVENLSDAQMKQLNQIIRQAIYDVIVVTKNPDKDRNKEDAINWLVKCVPDYWEIPQEVSKNLLFDKKDLEKRRKELSL